MIHLVKVNASLDEIRGNCFRRRGDPLLPNEIKKNPEEHSLRMDTTAPSPNTQGFTRQGQGHVVRSSDEEGPPPQRHRPPLPPQVFKELKGSEVPHVQVVIPMSDKIPCSVAKFGDKFVVLKSDEGGTMSLEVNCEGIHLESVIPLFYDSCNGVTDQSFDLILPLNTVSTLNVTYNEAKTHLQFKLTAIGGLTLKNSTFLALGLNVNQAEFSLVAKGAIPRQVLSKWGHFLQNKLVFINSGDFLANAKITIGFKVDSIHLGKYCYTGVGSIGLFKGTIALHMRRNNPQGEVSVRILFPKDIPIKYYLCIHERNKMIQPLLFISLKSSRFVKEFEYKLEIKDLGDHFDPESTSKETKYLALLLNVTPNLEKQLAYIQKALGDSCKTPKPCKFNSILYSLRQNFKRVATMSESLPDEVPTNTITPKRSLGVFEGPSSTFTPSTFKLIKLDEGDDVKISSERSNGVKFTSFKKPSGIKIDLKKPGDVTPIEEPVEELSSSSPDTRHVKSDEETSSYVKFKCFRLKAGDFLICAIGLKNPGSIRATFSPRGLHLKTNAPKFHSRYTKRTGQKESYQIPMNAILEILVNPSKSFDNSFFIGVTREEGSWIRKKFGIKETSFLFRPDEDRVYGKTKYLKIHTRASVHKTIREDLAGIRALFGDRMKLMDDLEVGFYLGLNHKLLDPKMKFYCTSIHLGTLKYRNESFFRLYLNESCNFQLSILDSKVQNVVTFDPGCEATYELGQWRTEGGSPRLLLCILIPSSRFAYDLERGLKLDFLVADDYDPFAIRSKKRHLILMVKFEYDELKKVVARIRGALTSQCVDISGNEKRMKKLRKVVEGCSNAQL